MAFKTGISGLNKRQRVMSGIVGIAALLAGFYTLYYDPSQKRIAAIHREIGEKDKKLQTARMHADLFEPLKKKVAELEAHLDLLKVKAATKGETISLIKTIENEAQRLDMKVINMFTNVEEPPPPTEKEKESAGKDIPSIQTPSYTKTIIGINLLGRYDKQEDFLKTLQNMETFIVIDKLDLYSDETIYPLTSSDIEITLYSEKGVDNSAIAE